MVPYPVHEHLSVQAYRTPLHTDSRKRGFTASRDLCCASVFVMDFLLFKCILVHLYHVSNLTVFKALSQLIDTRLIAEACRTTQYLRKCSSAQGHTMNLYDYENNPGIFNIHEEQT